MSIGKLAIAVTAFLLLVPIVSIVASDDSDAVTEEYTFKGVFGIYQDSEVIAAKNLNVQISVSDVPTVKASAKTDENGVFTIKMNLDETQLTKLILSYSLEKYGVPNPPMTLEKYEGKLLITETCPHEDKVYSITPTSNLDHCILLQETNVPVTVTVSGNDRLLRGANVKLTMGDLVFQGETKEGGKVTFKGEEKMPVGVYKIEIICNGYQDYSEENIEIYSNPSNINITMIQKEIPTYYGITEYHILMLAGVFIGLILVITSYILCKRAWSGMDSTE